MAKGATVFRNTGCDGKTDLCFKYSGSIYEVDVKLARWSVSGNGYASWSNTDASLVRPPVYPLLVIPETGADLSGWYCRWLYKKGKVSLKEYNCPPGLENLWD